MNASDVIGYVEAGDGVSALAPSLAALSSVAIDGVNITASGTGISTAGAGERAILAKAHSSGERGELLLGNFTEALGDFDTSAAHKLFASDANRRAVIAALVAGVAAQGWDGVQLDFESLDAADMNGLTRFTTELRSALPAARTLSMAVMASATTQEYRDSAYDLPALARQLTHVVLMAYDQHGPTWSGPGPVGGLPWVKTTLTALLASVPAAKVVLGVAGYGYTWPTRETGTQLSDAAARAVAKKGVATWDATQGEWHATLAAGGELWWSDAKSLQVRRNVARSLGIDGVAVWSLGLSDPVTE